MECLTQRPTTYSRLEPAPGRRSSLETPSYGQFCRRRCRNSIAIAHHGLRDWCRALRVGEGDRRIPVARPGRLSCPLWRNTWPDPRRPRQGTSLADCVGRLPPIRGSRPTVRCIQRGIRSRGAASNVCDSCPQASPDAVCLCRGHGRSALRPKARPGRHPP